MIFELIKIMSLFLHDILEISLTTILTKNFNDISRYALPARSGQKCPKKMKNAHKEQRLILIKW